MEVVKVGSRRPSSEYYQLIRHQCGRVPAAQEWVFVFQTNDTGSSLCCRGGDGPEARQRFVPLHDGLVPELKLWVVDVQRPAAGLLPRPAARVNATKHKKLFIIEVSRMIGQLWYISFCLEKKKTQTKPTLFSVWVVEVVSETCSIPTVTVFQVQLRVSRT